jgi:multidrug resistance efflux pump
MSALAIWLLRHHRWQSSSVVGIARGRVYQISATYAGRIRSIPVRLFDRVSKGQVVAVMDDGLLTAQIATISAEMERLKAEYEKGRSILHGDVKDRWSEWAAERRAFTNDVVQLTVSILELNTVLETDRALLKGLELEVQNASKLVKDNAIPAIELDRAKAAQKSLAAKIRENESLLKQSEAERKTAQERREDFTRHEPVLPSREIDLAHLGKAIEVQEGLIQELRVQRAEMVLRAPFDGVVIEIQPRAREAALRRPGDGVLRRPGEVVTPGEPILAITELRPSEIVAYVGEDQLLDLREGALLEIRTRTRPVRTGRSRALAVAPTVERLPERLWMNQVPAWGRPLLVSIPPGMVLSPGELVWVRPR